MLSLMWVANQSAGITLFTHVNYRGLVSIETVWLPRRRWVKHFNLISCELVEG